MNCEQARLQIGADPAGSAPELEAHVAGCADCAGYRREMRALDGDLRLAMAWPKGVVAEPVAHADDVVPLRPATARRWALAASVLLVGVLAASFFALQPRDALAAAIVAHMADEPDAWSKTQPIPRSALGLVLARSGVRLGEVESGDVVYANSCFLRGRQRPHLVVSTPTGPVTVIVLRGESVPQRVPFEEGRYSGLLLPVPGGGGGIAVLARGGTGTGAGGRGARHRSRGDPRAGRAAVRRRGADGETLAGAAACSSMAGERPFRKVQAQDHRQAGLAAGVALVERLRAGGILCRRATR